MNISIMNWTVSLVAIAVLIVYLVLRNKKRRERTLAPLKEFAAEYGTEIAEYDTWANTIIGSGTEEPKTLFFIRSAPDGESCEAIKLSEVSGCTLIKPERRVTYKKEYLNVIDRITLNFTFHDQRPELVLEFYNNDYDSLTLTGELQLAQKWARLVSNLLIVRRDRKFKTLDKKIQNVPIPRNAAKAAVSLRPGKLKRPLEKRHPA